MPSGRVQVLRGVLRENPTGSRGRKVWGCTAVAAVPNKKSRGASIVRIQLAESYFSPDHLPIHYYSRENLPSPDSSSRVTTIEKQTHSFR